MQQCPVNWEIQKESNKLLVLFMILSINVCIFIKRGTFYETADN